MQCRGGIAGVGYWRSSCSQNWLTAAYCEFVPSIVRYDSRVIVVSGRPRNGNYRNAIKEFNIAKPVQMDDVKLLYDMVWDVIAAAYNTVRYEVYANVQQSVT
ncbi:hypothetical protein CBL_00505 [Carabus blaptoides fortunei]